MSGPLPKLLLLGLLAGSAGCGEGPPAPRITVAAPHGGFLVELPGGKGYVEFITETITAGGRKKADQSILIVYFLMPDGKTAFSPAPSNVLFNMTLEGVETPVPLQPAPKAPADPGDPGRFASAIGSYSAGSEIQGELAATLGGAAIKVPILAR